MENVYYIWLTLKTLSDWQVICMHCTLSSNYFYASFVMILNDFRKKSIAMSINIGNASCCYFGSAAADVIVIVAAVVVHVYAFFFAASCELCSFHSFSHS